MKRERLGGLYRLHTKKKKGLGLVLDGAPERIIGAPLGKKKKIVMRAWEGHLAAGEGGYDRKKGGKGEKSRARRRHYCGTSREDL